MDKNVHLRICSGYKLRSFTSLNFALTGVHFPGKLNSLRWTCGLMKNHVQAYQNSDIFDLSLKL